jgi:hypothetical protein
MQESFPSKGPQIANALRNWNVASFVLLLSYITNLSSSQHHARPHVTQKERGLGVNLILLTEFGVLGCLGEVCFPHLLVCTAMLTFGPCLNSGNPFILTTFITVLSALFYLLSTVKKNWNQKSQVKRSLLSSGSSPISSVVHHVHRATFHSSPRTG